MTLPPSPAGVLDDYLIGKPQNRAGIGDVDAAMNRYAESRADLIALFRQQPWFMDGLTREESLFVERSITFVARYSGPRTAYVGDETVRDRLFKYDKVALSKGETELLLIYEPGQDAEREMRMIKQILPALESTIGVEYPERVMTVVNGAFEINDFNDGQFIRIARCCTLSPFILAHELAHTYWSIGASWLNEGMADLYAVMVLERLNAEKPDGWTQVPAGIDSYVASRRRTVQSSRFPTDLTLLRRFAEDGLYEAADVFLYDIRKIIGSENFLAAGRDIYLASDFGRMNLREKRIEDIFLAYAKGDQREAVMALFNESIWGDSGERYRELDDQEKGVN